MTATTSIHLPKPVSTDLTINSDLLLEGQPTKAEEALSALLDTNPVF